MFELELGFFIFVAAFTAGFTTSAIIFMRKISRLKEDKLRDLEREAVFYG